jgi:glycosyltransferase involved in cell wall biosynthesis
MADNKKVSVIIPVFNAEKTLKKSIESVINQTYTNLEIILVDDGSTDSSSKICNEYLESDNRVVVIHQQNSGVSKARNAGIKAASGDYVVFLDSDDEYSVELIKDNIEIIDKNEADILIYNFIYYVDGKPVENGYSLNEIFFGDDKEFFENELCMIMKNDLMNAPWNKIIRRELITCNDIHFDEQFSIFEDAMFSVEVCKKAKKICINSKPYYYYYLWNQGSLRTKMSLNRFDAIKKLYELEREYCDNYTDNKKQLSCFEDIFCHNLVVYLQTVSVNSKLDRKTKLNMLRAVCNDKKARKAFPNYLKNRDVDINKKIIGLCLLMRMPDMIARFFCLKQKM